MLQMTSLMTLLHKSLHAVCLHVCKFNCVHLLINQINSDQCFIHEMLTYDWNSLWASRIFITLVASYYCTCLICKCRVMRMHGLASIDLSRTLTEAFKTQISSTSFLFPRTMSWFNDTAWLKVYFRSCVSFLKWIACSTDLQLYHCKQSSVHLTIRLKIVILGAKVAPNFKRACDVSYDHTTHHHNSQFMFRLEASDYGSAGFRAVIMAFLIGNLFGATHLGQVVSKISSEWTEEYHRSMVLLCPFRQWLKRHWNLCDDPIRIETYTF